MVTARPAGKKPVLLYVINEAFFFLSHRSELAQAALGEFEVHLAAPQDHVWAPAGFDVSQIKAMGIQWHALPLSRRGQSPIQELRTVFHLARIMREVRPSLMHLLTIKPNIYGGLLARVMGVPAVVYSMTGLGQVFVARGLHGRLRRLAIRAVLALAFSHRNATVIVQNSSDFNVVASLLPAAQAPVLIKGAGADLSAFNVTPEPEGPPLTILAARLIWEKGIGEFAAAAKIIREKGIAARFALVGDTHSSNPRAVPEETLRSWAPIVEWWGRRDDMPAVMAAAHIVSLPSGYGEGVPKVLIEAAAAGRPIVASDIPGCREVVVEGQNGLLVPVGNADALAAALERLIQNAPERVRMGARGRSIAEAEFDVRVVVDNTVGIYRHLLKAWSSSGR